MITSPVEDSRPTLPDDPWKLLNDTIGSLLSPREGDVVTEEVEESKIAAEVEGIFEKIFSFSLSYKEKGERLLNQRMTTMPPEQAAYCRALFSRLSGSPASVAQQHDLRKDDMSDALLISIAQHALFRELDVAGCKHVTDAGICHVVRASQSVLTSLYLGRTPVSDASLFVVAAHCCKLRVLDVSQCDNITDASICAVMRGGCGKTITWLNLSKTHISDAALRVIAEEGKQLEGIDISECQGITDSGLNGIMSQCRSLRTFYMKKCKGVVDGGLTAIPKRGSLLGEVVLTQCPRMESASLITLAIHCPHLTMLHLNNVPAIANALATLACRATNLTSLVLAHCYTVRDSHLRIIGKSCFQLERLNIRGCFNVTDKGVQLLASGSGATKLEKIDLSGTYVGDAGIASLAKNCQELVGIAVEGCPITDEGIRAVVGNCIKLRELRLDQTAVSDVGLDLIAASLKQLKEIGLKGCSKITDRGIAKLQGSITSVECI